MSAQLPLSEKTNGLIRFTVYGRPQPQGSARGFVPKGWTRAVITSANKNLKPWRQEVASAACEAVRARGIDPVTEHPLFTEHAPVEVTLRFYFTRPKSATTKKRPGMTTKPDADKLLRAVLDSLTGIAFRDDAQVVETHVRKHYGGPERVEIEVQEAIA